MPLSLRDCLPLSELMDSPCLTHLSYFTIRPKWSHHSFALNCGILVRHVITYFVLNCNVLVRHVTLLSSVGQRSQLIFEKPGPIQTLARHLPRDG